MTDDTFIRTILASPDDDGPRLVYADWLEEQGDSERAELIRVQCELDAKWSGKCLKRPMATREAVPLWPCCAVCDLRRRERQLLLARGFDWVPCPGVKLSRHDDGVNVSFLVVTTFVIGSGIRCRFRRGFVELAECPWSDWLAHADAVLAACPIQDVTLTTMPHVFGCDARDWSHEDAVVALKTGGKTTLMLRDEWPYDGPVITRLLSAEWPSVKNWHLPPLDGARYFDETADLAGEYERMRDRVMRSFAIPPTAIDPRFLIRGTN